MLSNIADVMEQADVMEIPLVVGNRGGRLTLWNRGDIGLSPASRETAQTNKPPKHYTKNISSSLKKKIKHTQWVRDPIRVQV